MNTAFKPNIFKLPGLMVFLMTVIQLHAQEYRLSEISKGIYEIKVDNYEAVENICGNSLSDFLNNTTDKPDGIVIIRNKAGQKVRQIEYHHHKKHGLEKKWYPNGQIKYEGEWVRGKLKHYSAWYENGQKSWERIGDYHTSWYRNGSKESEGYLKNGSTKRWYPNGQLKEEGRYGSSIAKKTGLWKFYDKHGKLEQEINYP